MKKKKKGEKKISDPEDPMPAFGMKLMKVNMRN